MKKILKAIAEFVKTIILNMWLYDPNFEIDGEKWRLHKYDADQNFPSVPHMDCITDRRKKMDIYKGEIYVKRKMIRKASKKEWKRLWEDDEFREFVYADRIRYSEMYEKEYKKEIPSMYVEQYEEYKRQRTPLI